MAKATELEKVCEWCKQTFIAQKITTRYCSHSCNSKAYKSAKREEKHKSYKMVSIGAKRLKQIALFLKKVFAELLKDVEPESIKSHLKDDPRKGIILIQEKLRSR